MALVGDEPHYLALSQSLARDHDLNVFNQYFRGGFKEFLDVEKLAAHGTWGKGFKRIYSYHLPGVSLTLAPFFFFKLSPPLLYFLLRSFLGLFGALLAVLVYLFGLRLWRSRSLAFFATLVFSLTAPVFFYSFHIFPEVQAMLLVLSALYLLFFKAGGNDNRSLWAGLLLGATIFWGVKYALFIYPFALGFFAYWIWKKKFRPALLLLVFPLLFQALFFYYLYHAYGNFSPNSVYYGMLSPAQAGAFYDTILKKITLNMRWETLLDYFFDQRDGLLLYNPFYFFAFPGLLLALKNFKRYRLHLLAALPAAAVRPQPRLFDHPRRLLPARALPDAGRLGAAALRRDLLPGKPQPLFQKSVPRACPCIPFSSAAYQVTAALHALPAHHPRYAAAPGPDVPELEQQPHRPARPAALLYQDRQPRLPAQCRVPRCIPFAAGAGPGPMAPGEQALRRPGLRPGFFRRFFPCPAFSPGPELAAPPTACPDPAPCPAGFISPRRPASAAEEGTWLISARRCRLRLETLVPLEVAAGQRPKPLRGTGRCP